MRPAGPALLPVPAWIEQAAHVLDRQQPTPYVLMNLHQIDQAYDRFRQVFPGVAIHYAMKRNPELPVLERLHCLGSGFEVASYTELELLMNVGVDPSEVIFSNPVKKPLDIAQAWNAGFKRFACDSISELKKLAQHAPGCSVFLRLGTTPVISEVPSEGKFGVSTDEAFELILQARQLDLVLYGLAFHVGSQMLDPTVWDHSIQRACDLMRRLQRNDITLQALDIGGGFPAQYAEPVPSIFEFGRRITACLAEHLPYEVHVLAEPGRALVAEAGIMVVTVLAVARRYDQDWLHLDVATFHGLMEALETGTTLPFPMWDLRPTAEFKHYNITGPSCDSQDTVRLGVMLSADLDTGDIVLIGTAGAYTTAYATEFNGFKLQSVRYFDPH